MSSHPCVSECGCFLASSDGHDHCLTCLGQKHAEKVFVDGACSHCNSMIMLALRSRLSFTKVRVASAVTQPTATSHSRAMGLVNTLGDLRVTVGALPPGQSPCTSHSTSVPFDDGAGNPACHSTLWMKMSIAASESGLLSSEEEDEAMLPPLGGLLMLNQIQI